MPEALNISRHESVFNPSDFDYPVHIIGVGATGSRVFASLVELGMKQIHVYDYDLVESHNLANQIYMDRDIGQPKIRGCEAFLRQKLGITGTTPTPPTFGFHEQRVTPAYLSDIDHNMRGGIVFLLTDTMDSRRKIFTALAARCSFNVENSALAAAAAPMVIIETRMGSTHGSVFTINPFDAQQRKDWLSTLVDDTDADTVELSPCGTTLSVGTTASLIANYAVWQMMHFFVDPLGLQPRIDLFFKPTLTVTSPALAA